MCLPILIRIGDSCAGNRKEARTTLLNSFGMESRLSADKPQPPDFSRLRSQQYGVGSRVESHARPNTSLSSNKPRVSTVGDFAPIFSVKLLPVRRHDVLPRPNILQRRLRLLGLWRTPDRIHPARGRGMVGRAAWTASAFRRRSVERLFQLQAGSPPVSAFHPFPPFGRPSNGRKLRPVDLCRTGRAQVLRSVSLCAGGAGCMPQSAPLFGTHA